MVAISLLANKALIKPRLRSVAHLINQSLYHSKGAHSSLLVIETNEFGHKTTENKIVFNTRCVELVYYLINN